MSGPNRIRVSRWYPMKVQAREERRPYRRDEAQASDEAVRNEKSNDGNRGKWIREG